MEPRESENRRTALVTGCSSGFGLLTSVELARRGFRVYATMRDLRKRAGHDTAARAARALESRRDPKVVARAVARVAMAAHPRLRYQVGVDAHLAKLARLLLPDRLLDGAMRRLQG